MSSIYPSAKSAFPQQRAPPRTRPGACSELLRRTEEKREERKQQRLNDYYKRNFPEYFKFDGGSEAAATARGLSPETAAAMRKWLEDNEDQPMPGLRKRD